jgi:acetylxylan esterase
MIVARASTEPPGQGIIGAVATSVQGMTPGSDTEGVDYPATLQNFNTSEPAGTIAMTKLITEYAASCPNSKIALLGYSQVFVFHVLPRVYNQHIAGCSSCRRCHVWNK